MSLIDSYYGATTPALSQAVALTTQNVTVGDLVVVCARTGDARTGVSDNLGNTYTEVLDDSFDSFGMFRSVITTAGSCTVTVTQNSSARIGVAVHHYNGMAASPLDQVTDVNEGAGTSSATDAFTTTTANQVVVAMWGGSATPTPEAAYGGANLEGNDTGRLFTCHRFVSSILTSETVDWTHASTGFQCAAASFKEASGGGGYVLVAN